VAEEDEGGVAVNAMTRKLKLALRVGEGLLQFALLMVVFATRNGWLFRAYALWRVRGERGYGF
jgi:hypothetical protein